MNKNNICNALSRLKSRGFTSMPGLGNKSETWDPMLTDHKEVDITEFGVYLWTEIQSNKERDNKEGEREALN